MNRVNWSVLDKLVLAKLSAGSQDGSWGDVLCAGDW